MRYAASASGLIGARCFTGCPQGDGDKRPGEEGIEAVAKLLGLGPGQNQRHFGLELVEVVQGDGHPHFPGGGVAER
ncbi:hypothetical protein Smic_82630 [Streptomyces microflavus]|uniref:Uncharacterized protein n=1 Tax=Streptomyces microflavus TaxID=1919 RepID=A0A7J0D6J0_STRMI|nr:hypothetical protein Smic_82630 [Streptomyces microflavus]